MKIIFIATVALCVFSGTITIAFAPPDYSGFIVALSICLVGLTCTLEVDDEQVIKWAKRLGIEQKAKLIEVFFGALFALTTYII